MAGELLLPLVQARCLQPETKKMSSDALLNVFWFAQLNRSTQVIYVYTSVMSKQTGRYVICLLVSHVKVIS